MDQRQIHVVENVDQGPFVDGVTGEEHFVSHQRGQGGRGTVGDPGGTDLAAVACLRQYPVNRLLRQLRQLCGDGVQEFVIRLGDQAAIGVDTDAVEPLHESVEQC